jgi:predicted metalloprotease
MRWDEFRRSENVEDARGGGFARRVPGGAGGIGIGTLIILALVGWALSALIPKLDGFRLLARRDAAGVAAVDPPWDRLDP